MPDTIGNRGSGSSDSDPKTDQGRQLPWMQSHSHRHADGPFRAGSPVPRPLGHRLRRSSCRVCVGGRFLGHVAASMDKLDYELPLGVVHRLANIYEAAWKPQPWHTALHFPGRRADKFRHCRQPSSVDAVSPAPGASSAGARPAPKSGR